MNKPNSKPRATITEVAKAAGVATGTVSRVFNKHPDVNIDIRRRVNEAAAKLGYVRQRKRTRSAHHSEVGNIGVIFFGMQDTLAQLPVVSSAVHGIEVALSEIGRNLMLSNIPEGDRIPPFLAENRVEGVIIKGPNQGALPNPEENDLLRHVYSYPHVWLMGRLPNARGDHCNFDTDAAGRLVARHLHAKGHRRVCFLNPKPGQSQFEKLKQSFFVAAERLSLETSALEVEPPPLISWPLPATTSQEHVETLVDQWMNVPAERRATAIFVPSDRTAVQLYSALERRSLQVGKDVSVISCNNEMPLLMDLRPGLTTIDVHPEVVGQRAVDQLLWRIRHPQENLSFRILVSPSLVERESVAQL
ncbi:MAG: LacI family DNA-binding transcriptional regulator [Verrucomicrobiota bacterium JB022]|nr:LacI family DNA-binding transcriptional regulator [Verrucomicrobiota bacterium JB022]